MDRILAWLERTTDDQWCVDWCGVEDEHVPGGVKFCVQGHLMTYGEFHGHKGFDDLFHEVWATEYMYYWVNDGKSERYQQATPKQRVMAYFTDLRDGKVMSTQKIMEVELQRLREQRDKAIRP